MSVYVHVVDSDITAVLMRNDSDLDQTLPDKSPLGTIVDYDGTAAYAVDSDLGDLARCPPAQNMPKPCDSEPTELETKLPNGITIYGNEHAVAMLEEVVNSYPNLWIDTGNVTLPDPSILRYHCWTIGGTIIKQVQRRCIPLAIGMKL